MGRSLTSKLPIVAIDLETTGVDVKTAKIIEISIVRGLEDGAHVTQRLNPGVPIPSGASKVHGIHDADVADCPLFADVCQSFLPLLKGVVLTGFNLISYDVPLLTNEYARVGITWPEGGDVDIIDTHYIFKKREPRTLSKAVEYYLGRDHDGAHGAYADARASLEILHAQVAKYDDLPGDIDDLIGAVHGPDPSWVDSAGKLVWNDNGEAVFTFGKVSGMSLKAAREAHTGYLAWILKQDFADDLKQICKDAMRGIYPRRPAA